MQSKANFKQVNYSFADKLITYLDNALKGLQKDQKDHQSRPSPATSKSTSEEILSESEKALVGGLMRINHTGEVCAQALYKGQALTASSPQTRDHLLEAAKEEKDHLAWCEERLNSLGEPKSKLNPIFYSLSFTLGTITGAMGDKVSLGFVAETEEQVGHHLTQHLNRVPYKDQATRAVLEQMRIDEERHGAQATENGGQKLSFPIRLAMRGMASIMKFATFRI